MSLVLCIAAALHAPHQGDANVPRVARDTVRAPVTVTDTTWYITNRARVAGKLVGARTDTLEYGYVVVRYRERADRVSLNPWVEGFSRTTAEPVRLSRDAFLARVGAASTRGTELSAGLVLYTHGFATSFSRAIAQGSDIAHRGRQSGPFVVFAWPAHISFASFPRPSALISKAYRDDSVSAAESAGAFRGALADLLSIVPAKRLAVVGHSLGAQLASEALTTPSQLRDSLVVAPLHALVLFAPDISAPRFRDVLGPALVPVANRRVIYASEADRLLTVSRLINHSPRVGQGRGEKMLTESEVEIVDVTEGRRAAGAIRNLFEPHHAMRYASSALRDFFGVVRGTPSDCRASDGLAERKTDRSWRLTAKAPPAADVACAAGVSTVTSTVPARGDSAATAAATSAKAHRAP